MNYTKIIYSLLFVCTVFITYQMYIHFKNIDEFNDLHTKHEFKCTILGTEKSDAGYRHHADFWLVVRIDELNIPYTEFEVSPSMYNQNKNRIGSDIYLIFAKDRFKVPSIMMVFLNVISFIIYIVLLIIAISINYDHNEYFREYHDKVFVKNRIIIPIYTFNILCFLYLVFVYIIMI